LKILVTGGAGFVGSHLIPELQILGHEVTVLDNFSTSSRNLNTPGTGFAEFVDGSIIDEPLTSSLIKDADQVVHLAAAVGVANIMESPLRGLQTNVIGSEIVIRNCAKYAKPILLTSTSEIYGKNDYGPLDEYADRVIGVPQIARWSYSDSKAIEEAFALAYSREHGLEVKIARLFNTVGPGQKSEFGMVLPNFVKSALSNDALKVHGDGSQKRCFMHVQDAIRGIIAMLSIPISGSTVFNLGNPEEVSILNLANIVIERSKSKSKIEFTNYDQVFGENFEDMKSRVPNIHKAKSELLWNPTKSLVEIIDDSIRYELNLMKLNIE
jgi:UDP-glucose 4-epimerase